MAKIGFAGAPTMIIPDGTDIRVDAHGQLSIRTPGNLVIQNSGTYATLESVSGSIRIEPDVAVEAVTVRCADSCYVQGSLTAWRVIARTLHLDGSARAFVMMQQTERLEVGRDARLVGNFRSEKELFELFSRFGRQARSLPLPPEGGVEAVEAVDAEVVSDTAPPEAPAPAESAPAADAPRDEPADLAEELFFARILLEREAGRPTHGPTARRIIGELVKLLRGGDLETLRLTHRTLFGRLEERGADLERARRLVAGHFDRETAE